MLRRPKFQLGPERIDAALRRVKQRSLLFTDLPTVTECRHEPDDRFLECAQASNAHFLVTGNARDFPARWRATQVVNSRLLLTLVGPALLNQESQTP